VKRNKRMDRDGLERRFPLNCWAEFSASSISHGPPLRSKSLPPLHPHHTPAAAHDKGHHFCCGVLTHKIYLCFASLDQRPYVPIKMSPAASLLSSGVRCEIQSSSDGHRVSQTLLLVSLQSTERYPSENCKKRENGRREDEPDDHRELEC
jgi:hypothetical protein